VDADPFVKLFTEFRIYRGSKSLSSSHLWHAQHLVALLIFAKNCVVNGSTREGHMAAF